MLLQIEEVSRAVRARVSDLQQQGSGDGAGLHRLVEGALCSDDRLLSSLQKLGQELRIEDTEDAADVAKLRATCARSVFSLSDCPHPLRCEAGRG